MEKKEQEKVERRKPCTTAKIYRYRVLNTSVCGLRGDGIKARKVKMEGRKMEHEEGIKGKDTRPGIERIYS